MQYKIKLVLLIGFIFTMICFAGDRMLKKGMQAPDFTLKTELGETIKLSDFLGRKNVVLIFYPGNNTPICTKQLCEIKDNYAEFTEKDVVVFGINSGKIGSQKEFSENYIFPFQLLLDEEESVIRQYGTEGWLWNKRTVFVIDITGKILWRKHGKPSVTEILSYY